MSDLPDIFLSNFLPVIDRVALGIVGHGVMWVSGLPTFLKPFFDDVLNV